MHSLTQIHTHLLPLKLYKWLLRLNLWPPYIPSFFFLENSPSQLIRDLPLIAGSTICIIWYIVLLLLFILTEFGLVPIRPTLNSSKSWTLLASVNLINENYDNRCNAEAKASQSPQNGEALCDGHREMISPYSSFLIPLKFCNFAHFTVTTGGMRQYLQPSQIA